jgi:hypothetical protein
MGSTRATLMAVLGLTCWTAAAFPQGSAPPDFDLRIEAPRVVIGEPLAIERVTASVLLDTQPVAGGGQRGAQGWALSLRATGGARIIEATVRGTAGDVRPTGFRDDGFEVTELTEGPGNEGAISVMVLSLSRPAMLPPRGTARLLELTVESQIPEAAAGCREVWIEFHDYLALKSSGARIHNALVFEGQTRKDDGGPLDNDTDREEPARISFCSALPLLRADCNSDRRVNIADAVFALNYLFLGGRKSSCHAACDIDADGAVLITDAIYLLNFLFLGGRAIPQPFPVCNQLPALEPLGCEESNCPP